MSEEKDTAVSPEVAEEQPVDNAEEGAVQEEKEEVKKNPPRPKDYVFVNHMMRSARSGLKRHARSGNRRQGVILDNGQRLRRRGARLMNEVNLRTMVECHRRFLDYIEAGIIEVYDPNGMKIMSLEQVIARIEEVGSRMTPGEKKMKVEWSPSAVDPKPDSTRPNMKVAEELAQTPEATGEDEETSDETDEETAELTDEVTDPTDEESEGEDTEATDDDTVVGEGEPDEGLTEEELMKQNREQLNDTALEYGVEDPESYRTKQDVVDAIFAAQAGEEG